SSVGVGEAIKVKWSKPRSLPFHRRAMALLQVGFENQDRYATFNQFRTAVKIELGMFDPVINAKGEVIYVPQSWSFEKMDEVEFRKAYSEILDLMIRVFVKGSTPEELDNAAMSVLSFA
ncbi:MAG: DUF1367 family protein, partial [Silanimonas sp.]